MVPVTRDLSNIDASFLDSGAIPFSTVEVTTFPAGSVFFTKDLVHED